MNQTAFVGLGTQAVRTMGCIRVDKITEYICDPLQRALRDTDPYVRKTAAVCVAKLYDISPEVTPPHGSRRTVGRRAGAAGWTVPVAVAALPSWAPGCTCL